MFKRKKNEQEAMEAENAIEMRSPLDEWNDSQQDDLGAKPKMRFFFRKEKGEKPEEGNPGWLCIANGSSGRHDILRLGSKGFGGPGRPGGRSRS